MCRKVKIKLPGQSGVELWAGWLDLPVAALWIILISPLFLSVFFAEGLSWGVCGPHVCEVYFEVNLFVLCLIYNGLFWKGRLPDWCSVIFFLCCVLLASLCSSSHPSRCLSLSPATKLWRSGRQRCGGRGDSRSGSFVGHLSSHRSVTCSLQAMRCDTENTVSKAIKVFFFSSSRCKMTKTPRWNMYSKRQKTICLSDFFYCQFESAIQVWCYSDKINRIFPAGDRYTRRNNFSLSWHENYHSLVLKGKEKVSFCSFTKVSESLWNSERWIFSKTDSWIYCLKVKTNLNSRGDVNQQLGHPFSSCSSIQDYQCH